MLWHNEGISRFEYHRHAIEEVYATKKTAYQEMQIVKFYQFGKSLILDGKVQSSELDEFIYHECLVHPALTAIKDPKSVLIIGGGEGATLREAYTHPSITKQVMVDIDGDVVEACKQHLPEFHQGSFEDARTELVIQDAKTYVENCTSTFDLIVIDISEALEGTSAAFMFTREFYQMLSKLLTEQGLIVIQSGSLSVHETTFFMRVSATLRDTFPTVIPYAAHVPAYAALWGYHLVSPHADFTCPNTKEIDNTLKERGIETKYYDGIAHEGMTKLPKFIRTSLAKDWKIYSVTDQPKVYNPTMAST